MAEQLELFRNLPKEISRLNTLKNYGILKKDLDSFNYRQSREIYFGYHNIFMPHEMMQSLDAPEITVIFQGGYVIKKMPELFEALKEEFFEIIIPEMNKVVYRRSVGARTYRDADTSYTPHHDKDISQKRRLFSLDEKVKQQFIDSFRKNYVGSLEEDYGYGFEDVKYERLYKTSNFNFIKKTYKKNASGNT
ncbi:MAG: hypothetical protein QF362_03540 [Candidatus Woesearchaeota archaeon]|jgi:hypothetical protein|nr:hypothetical protein [Candidatus Woesearchaeota archaeon]MDP7506489.1 hypothetical protein [Candidatus Woesearchaeota archaeon]|tara:strand:+ start:3097 stop:3672 length:576 start_codon:yes stop_codon:yes gene_type:complete